MSIKCPPLWEALAVEHWRSTGADCLNYNEFVLNELIGFVDRLQLSRRYVFDFAKQNDYCNLWGGERTRSEFLRYLYKRLKRGRLNASV